MKKIEAKDQILNIDAEIAFRLDLPCKMLLQHVEITPKEGLINGELTNRLREELVNQLTTKIRQLNLNDLIDFEKISPSQITYMLQLESDPVLCMNVSSHNLGDSSSNE